MLRDIRKNKVFNRRTFIISGIQGGLATILLARLSYLQIFKYGEYQVQSDSNSIKPFIKPAARGLIVDNLSREIATNVKNYRLYFYLEDKSNAQNIIDSLTKILSLNSSARQEMMEKVAKARKRAMVSLLESLSWDDLARIEVNSYRLPGTSVEQEYSRKYPFSYETAHFLGYVSLPLEEDVAKREKSLYLHPSFRVGRTGLEKTYEEYLRGIYGVKYVEVNSLELPLRTISVKSPQIGPTLKSTIDIGLQEFAMKSMQDKVGSVVVMDVETGGLLSCCSSPSFDANKFVEGMSDDYWQQITTDARHPLNNRSVSAIYPPGSTFKLMTALAALESGLDPEVEHYCRGHFDLGNRRFRCWEEKGHGKLNLVEAIERSCNVYFYNLAEQIGIEKISEMARRFGYGQEVEVGLEGSRSGNIPSKKWKEKAFGQEWVGGDTLNSAIGQGFILATPIQMALVTARIANGGVKIDPYLVKNAKYLSQYKDRKHNKIVDEKHLQFILNGMNRVVNNKKGTAYYRRIKEERYKMAGKSGTSQVISKRHDEMTEAEMLINSNKNHAIFVGFAPVAKPKFAVSVVVEHGGGGSYAAAPIARDVLRKVQDLYEQNSVKEI